MEEGVVVRQLLHLLIRRLRQLLASVTDVHAPQSGHAVKNAVALRIPKVNAFRFGDHTGAFVCQGFGVGEGMEMVGVH